MRRMRWTDAAEALQAAVHHSVAVAAEGEQSTDVVANGHCMVSPNSGDLGIAQVLAGDAAFGLDQFKRVGDRFLE